MELPFFPGVKPGATMRPRQQKQQDSDKSSWLPVMGLGAAQVLRGAWKAGTIQNPVRDRKQLRCQELPKLERLTLHTKGASEV